MSKLKRKEEEEMYTTEVGDWQVQSQEFEGRKERERRKEGRDTTEG
jgi:hypothetical protein